MIFEVPSVVRVINNFFPRSVPQHFFCNGQSFSKLINIVIINLFSLDNFYLTSNIFPTFNILLKLLISFIFVLFQLFFPLVHVRHGFRNHIGIIIRNLSFHLLIWVDLNIISVRLLVLGNVEVVILHIGEGIAKFDFSWVVFREHIFLLLLFVFRLVYDIWVSSYFSWF